MENYTIEYFIKAYDLIKDAMSPTNKGLILMAIDDLIKRLKLNEISTLGEYIQFKEEWYPQLKNK